MVNGQIPMLFRRAFWLRSFNRRGRREVPNEIKILISWGKRRERKEILLPLVSERGVRG
jgi:hypothetical protein